VLSTNSPGWSGWDDFGPYTPRPYEQTFLVRSSDTSYKLGTNAAISLFSLVTADIGPPGIVSGNIVGYAEMPCLVPCSPEDADGSPTSFLFLLKLVPDITIKQLLTSSNGDIHGVVFNWVSDSTVLLQASPDLVNWTNVTYILELLRKPRGAA
jgi:hypothetical protein